MDKSESIVKTDDEDLNVYIARQPIFNKNLEVYAYELLFRDGSANKATIIDGDVASNKLILNTFSEFGFSKIVSGKLAFINITENLLLNLPPLPKEQVVLEVLENVNITSAIVTAVTKLADTGYTIALDDFVYSSSWEPLIAKAKIIKIDIMPFSDIQLQEHVAKLKPLGVKLLAERVETYAEYEFCRKLGFDYFQGYFFSKPQVLQNKQVGVQKQVVLQLLAELNKEQVDFDAIRQTIANDPKLMFKLLKIVNSAAFVKRAEIKSLEQAIAYLGIHKLRQWSNLLLMSGVSKPNELVLTAIARAKMCELVAKEAKINDIELCFTIGLFSMLDALMDMEMSELLAELNLSLEINKALLEHKGIYGELLASVESYIKGNWHYTSSNTLTAKQYADAYFASISWAEDTYASLFVTN